jgi:hypothetical protein
MFVTALNVLSHLEPSLTPPSVSNYNDINVNVSVLISCKTKILNFISFGFYFYMFSIYRFLISKTKYFNTF